MTKDDNVIEEIFIYKESRICISKNESNEFLQLIEDILPAVEQCMVLTLQQLCGNHYWLSKTDGERRNLGKYFAFLVEDDRLPFEFADSRCGAPKRYCLK